MTSIHRHEQDSWDDYPNVRCTEIGPDVCIRQLGRHGKPDGFVAGFIISHEVASNEFRCEGYINVDPEHANDGKVWTMTGSLGSGDLTLAPSIQCTTHPDFHAYVRNGAWTT